MALREDSVSIEDQALLAEERLAVILGTEGDGLADATIADCDYTVRIPMSHGGGFPERGGCQRGGVLAAGQEVLGSENRRNVFTYNGIFCAA